MTNHRDIIDFLLENKYANINDTKASDSYQDTALVIAVSEGYTSLTEYLIANGADVNYGCPNLDPLFATPVGCAVFNGHADALRLLYRAGADTNIKIKDGRTLLMVAAQRKYPMIIDVLLDESINTIEDVELVACSLVSANARMEELSYMLSILKITLEQRIRSNLPKVPLEAIAVYDYQRECQTVNELDSIKDDPDRVFIETLLIRERIALSLLDVHIVEPSQDYGITLVERGQYEKAFNWWIHTFYLYERIDLSGELAPIVWLFCRLLTENEIIPVEWFLKMARLVLEPSQLKDKNRSQALNTMYLIVIATKILKQEGLSQNDQRWIYSWVKNVCRLRLTSSDERTLLHICVDAETNQAIDFYPEDIHPHLKFPNKHALRLLLVCGSRWLDLDAIERSGGNTALHLACMNYYNREIVELLIESGCHTDCVNKDGRTPFDYIEDYSLKTYLDPSRKTPSKLKCLCAHLIAQEQLDMNELGAPTSVLNRFVILHGHHPEE